MGQQRIDARGLSENPLDAAAEFLLRVAPQVQVGGTADLAVIFDPADYTHGEWRLAAIRQLARDLAPLRVNAAIGPDGAALDETLAYLAAAPGVTGQILIVDAFAATSA